MKICSLKDKNKKCKTFQSSSNFIAFNLCYDMFDKSSVFHSFHCCSICSLHLFFMAGTRWSTLKCNPVLRKDCSNSSFSPLSVCSLPLPAVMKAGKSGHTQRELHWGFFSTLFCFERVQDHITSFAVSQSPQIQHLNQLILTAQHCKLLCAFKCLVLTPSEPGDHFAQICSPCSSLLTAQSTNQAPNPTFLC